VTANSVPLISKSFHLVTVTVQNVGLRGFSKQHFLWYTFNCGIYPWISGSFWESFMLSQIFVLVIVWIKRKCCHSGCFFNIIPRRTLCYFRYLLYVLKYCSITVAFPIPQSVKRQIQRVRRRIPINECVCKRPIVCRFLRRTDL